MRASTVMQQEESIGRSAMANDPLTTAVRVVWETIHLKRQIAELEIAFDELDAIRIKQADEIDQLQSTNQRLKTAFSMIKKMLGARRNDPHGSGCRAAYEIAAREASESP